MSFSNMLSAWQWGLLAAVPLGIVLLYFLKLRRQPLETPSTYLWRRSVEDMRVNSIWQRLRRSLLLFLQLAFVALVALAALRFGWNGSQLAGERIVLLVDNSASMGAVDVAPSRLAEAKRRCRELIDQMRSGDQAMIISFADAAQVEQPFTDNRNELRRRLEAVRQTSRPTSLAEALRLAAGFANPGVSAPGAAPRPADAPPAGASPAPEANPSTAAAPAKPGEKPADEAKVPSPADAGPKATLYIVSDGGFPDVATAMPPGLAPVFLQVGKPEAENLAIVAFSAKRPDARPDRLELFGRLDNCGPADCAAEVELYRDGSLCDATRVTVKARGSAVVTFELDDVHEATLEMVARPGGELAVDDHAWTLARPAEQTRILLVTPGDAALEQALASAGELVQLRTAKPDFLQSAGYRSAAESGAWNLVVYELCSPDAPPAANALYIGRTPPGDAWSLGARVENPQVIDVNAPHPIMSHVDLGNVLFASGQPLKPPPGGIPLIDSNAGVLYAVAQRDAWRDAVLSAEILTPAAGGTLERNTDWPLRLSFVVMLRNLIEHLGKRQDTAGETLAPGGVALLDGTGEALEVRSPGGAVTQVPRDRQGKFRFSTIEEPGVYEVLEQGSTRSRFAVNLFDSAESNIRPRDAKIRLGGTEVGLESRREGVRRETWKPLLLAALGFLLLEWYIYNRRIYV